MYFFKFPKSDETKGQFVSKKIVKPRILQKNERMNSFLLVCDVFSFGFLKNPRQEKKLFEIIWPLSTSKGSIEFIVCKKGKSPSRNYVVSAGEGEWYPIYIY